MIRKIKTTEYLKRYGDMTDGERKDYLKRVGEWLAGDGKRLLEMTDRPMAKAQNTVLMSARWGREDCGAFYEGTLLLSALVDVAETWLPMQLFAKSAYRAVRQMVEVMQTHPHPLPVMEGSERQEQKTGAVISEPSEKPTGTRPAGTAAMVTTPLHYREGQGVGLVPARPRHIDQYVHLLPQKTQERAAQVKGLLRDLDDAREKARLLMEAGEHSDKIELWARKATRIDSAVKSIYRELDSEWDKLVKQGRVVVDDLGNAHVVESEESRVKSEESAAAQELTSEQKHRRRELRKFLVDTRRGNGKTREEHVGKWQEAWKEYLTLEPKEAALEDEKILEAMKHYGILVYSL